VPPTPGPVPPSSSTVYACVPNARSESSVMSPLVVYSSAETSGSKPATAGSSSSPASAAISGQSEASVSTCQPSG
jgi:hypothetical protein